ncbi:hypothetical protein MMC13_005032 [Lambiella insularis]|nr:hypothetical protein [Lambiella insularis]
MPLPSTPLTIRGGCNCRAIRFQISIPALLQRPLHPWSDGEVHLPMVAIDHCNDCRRATGSVIPLWICAPTELVSASCLRRSDASPPTEPSTANAAAEAEGTRRWRPAAEVFQPGPASSETFLTSYHSSEGVTRTFCGRCGTNLTYARHPMPHGWPAMLDIVLGTVDREDLEGEWMQPERHCWWDRGIGWVRRLVEAGDGGLPRHPAAKVTERVE